MTSMLLTLQRVVLSAAGLAIAFPALTLLCWAYDHSILYHLHTSFRTLKPTTMLAVLFCGLSLWLQAE